MKLNIKRWLIENNTLIIFVLMVIFSAIISDSFFTANNISNLLRQTAPVGLISFGMLLVILTGGIDLSVGSVVAAIGVSFALLSHQVYFPWALLFSVLIGAGVGMISGYLVAYQRVAPFIATLAMMTVVRGTGYLISKGSPITVGEYSKSILSFGSGDFLGIPWSAIVLLIVFALVYLLLKYNAFGRMLIAIGSNEEAVRLSGISVSKYKFWVYVIIAVFSAIAALLMVSRTGVGTPNIGVGMELDVIAVVVIGGASLSGGKGSVVNTLLGAFILAMIGNVMNLLDVASYLQQVIKGVIILMAVIAQRYQKN
ncbi:ABC transporter permease [Pseudobacter ginsenosidimutans]|uniref:Monosaccharide ABC transporter membrane protein (CUT2 family) n=1 Tax=Pseudobacter ginsenosidimutans TaxID=661488 RepID=A0A4Q7M844_9BACT|nr:ABC transporter permease [Pseudobacter ginsenosidimutans]QEC42567.1 ABC transporter permease [Pseudobacter ginsenosidimutans]RZS63944.1 monosaccharide ABC transporter membrane protein (CUT2 family) [Pseudobacter ginsenosidimutans]